MNDNEFRKSQPKKCWHKLTTTLCMLMAVNTLVTIGAHWPIKPPVENMIYHAPAIVLPFEGIATPTGYIEELGFYKRIQDQTVLIECYNAAGRQYTSGSGVIIDSEKGIVLTARHVVVGAVKVKVTTNDQRSVIDNFETISSQDAYWITKMYELMFPPRTNQHAPLDPRPGIKRKIERQYQELQEKQQEKQEKKSSIWDLPHDLIFGKKKTTDVDPKADGGESDLQMKLYKDQDVAILHFNKDLKAVSAKFATSEPKIGDAIYVVGSPYGGTWFNTVTKGILSGKNRRTGRIARVKLYQTDAAILPGNSGGPWFNSKGELVAMTTAWVPSSGTVGIGVPLPELKKIVEKI